MRKIKILKINPSTNNPGSIEVQGNFTSMFAGRFYRNDAGQTQPGYLTSTPTGYTPIIATNFDITGNAKYNGRYTVYTRLSAADTNQSASYDAGTNRTTIRVTEVVRPIGSGDNISVVSDGNITNISTYLLETGGAAIIVPPGVTLSQYPIEIMGRNVIGWGEGFAQNFMNVTRNFAGAEPPVNPFVGQVYYDTDDQQVRVWNGTGWGILNEASTGKTFKHTQSTAATTWTVNHGMNLPAPYIAMVQFFVDRGNGPKLIMPSDVTFASANQLTVTFSNPEIGYVYIKS